MPKYGTDARAIEREVREFVVANFLFGRDDHLLSPGDSLVARGVLDSTGVMELAAFVEQAFGIVIPDDELSPENLDSIARLVRYVHAKLAG